MFNIFPLKIKLLTYSLHLSLTRVLYHKVKLTLRDLTNNQRESDNSTQIKYTYSHYQKIVQSQLQIIDHLRHHSHACKTSSANITSYYILSYPKIYLQSIYAKSEQIQCIPMGIKILSEYNAAFNSSISLFFIALKHLFMQFYIPCI